MSVAQLDERKTRHPARGVMKANVFRAPGRFGLEDRAIPEPGPGEALLRVLLTTLCETDLRIVKGEYPVAAGRVLGHEAVGVIHALGPGVTGLEIGQRVLPGVDTPCGQCESCQGGLTSQVDGPQSGRRLGSIIDGTQAEYVLIPHAQESLAVIPNALSDEQVLLLTHVASTGFAAAEQAKIKLGDTVAVFVHGSIGLCAVLGARLLGAADIIAIDKNPARLAQARQYGATITLRAGEELEGRIRTFTNGRGIDVACIDTAGGLGIQRDFACAARALRPGGTLLSVGVSCGHLQESPDLARAASAATSEGDRKELAILTTLCPGNRDRMARLMRLVQASRVDLSPLVTHLFILDEIVEAYDLFGSSTNGVLKVGIRVS